MNTGPLVPYIQLQICRWGLLPLYIRIYINEAMENKTEQTTTVTEGHLNTPDVNVHVQGHITLLSEIQVPQKVCWEDLQFLLIMCNKLHCSVQTVEVFCSTNFITETYPPTNQPTVPWPSSSCPSFVSPIRTSASMYKLWTVGYDMWIQNYIPQSLLLPLNICNNLPKLYAFFIHKQKNRRRVLHHMLTSYTLTFKKVAWNQILSFKNLPLQK